MNKYFIILMLAFLFVNAKAQNITTKTTLESRSLDTNAIIYDEQGKALRYYQYEKLVNSGNYTIHGNGAPGAPGTRLMLTKLSPEMRAQMYQMIKPMLAVSSGVLREGNTLDVTALLKQLKIDNLDNKALVFVFWYADCPPCTAAFETLNDQFKEIKDADIVTIGITSDGKGDAEQQLKKTPLQATYQLNGAGRLNGIFGVYNFPTYVVTDKSHVVKFALTGSSPVMIPAFVDAIKAVAANK